jgi:lipopolysaccharide/colanic/teichoic acid biosynthesis glycosyltransferase
VKRAFDLVVAAIGLVLTSPIVAVAALAIRLDSPGPVLFRQERIGRGFVPFTIFKLRTMRTGMGGPRITLGPDPRVTRVGRVLRRTKLDELPQLWNVLRGDMSLVGPRPEIREYVERFRADYEVVLRVRPGITDEASLVYRDEAAVLAAADDPERAYADVVLPHKLALAREYVAAPSMRRDLRVLTRTVFGGG